VPDQSKYDHEPNYELFENEGVPDADPTWYVLAIKELFLRVEELEKSPGAGSAPLSDNVLRAVFDQRDRQDRPKRKWYHGRATKKKGICVHHTAVSGGFGAHRSEIRRFGKFSPESLAREAVKLKDFSGRPLDANEIDDVINALALASRYRGQPAGKYNSGVPYHAISGPNSVLYLNLPFDWVTWHGNGANAEFLGYAWDANSTKDALDAEELVQDFRHLVAVARDEGHPIEWLTGHCAWANKPNDPGRSFIERVMVPVAKELDLKIDWEFKSGSQARSLGEIARGA
jgi:hypothetical protein